MTVRQCIVATANYYGRQISEDVLEMYAMDLADLSSDKVIDGYNRYRRNPANKTFPLPAQIRELVCPEEFVSVESQAREIAARIVGAIKKYGWNNAKEAELSIGPVGWKAVQIGGGWSQLCEGMRTNQEGVFQAQMRDLIEGRLRYGDDVLEEKVLRIEAREKQKELQPANFMQLFKPEPDGAA